MCHPPGALDPVCCAAAPDCPCAVLTIGTYDVSDKTVLLGRNPDALIIAQKDLLSTAVSEVAPTRDVSWPWNSTRMFTPAYIVSM